MLVKLICQRFGGQPVPIQLFPIPAHIAIATHVESNKAAAIVAAKIKKNNKVK